jgi:anti-anti-sigma factor
MADLSPGPAELTVTHSSEDGVPVLALSGELDMSNAAAVRQAIASSGAERAGRLVLDLSGLTFIDSAGIAVLLEAAERLDSVSLRAPAPAVWRVIEITGLTQVLPLES